MIRNVSDSYTQLHTCLSPLSVNIYTSNTHAPHTTAECFVVISRSDQILKGAQMNSEGKKKTLCFIKAHHCTGLLNYTAE